jgi:hypothetical protein
MQHLFVEYSLALKLKEAGFDEPCLGNYYEGRLYPWLTRASSLVRLEPGMQSTGHSYEGYKPQDMVFANNLPNTYDYIPAPIYQQVFDWLEGKGIVLGYLKRFKEKQYFFFIVNEHTEKSIQTKDSPTKRQAYDVAIEKALQLLKEKK